MFVRHTMDSEGRLEHLFWCDGPSQVDYQVFGDVAAFDETYGKNKYKCPVVVFSGVNNHNQTTIFASAVVANETEETYVWLLEQFVEAMKGKPPLSVITDGDMAMKNAIKKVFPGAHHRLCAWHLIRNAARNIGNGSVLHLFSKCMLGDYTVDEFKQRWNGLIFQFGLEDNRWVNEMYEKREMWATAYIRGKFFAGFRTISRCEALHSQMGRFVHSRHNLRDFVHHFNRCLNYLRYMVDEANYESIRGEQVLQTTFPDLERSGSSVFTREIFFIFRDLLRRSGAMTVADGKRTSSNTMYKVEKYRVHGKAWHVSHNPTVPEFRCSCQRLESYGLPCAHILVVIVKHNVGELPSCLVLDRWTNGAKDKVHHGNIDGSGF